MVVSRTLIQGCFDWLYLLNIYGITAVLPSIHDAGIHACTWIGISEGILIWSYFTVFSLRLFGGQPRLFINNCLIPGSPGTGIKPCTSGFTKKMVVSHTLIRGRFDWPYLLGSFLNHDWRPAHK
eukprot:8257966-Ditylum_brightwellii.AAC.1